MTENQMRDNLKAHAIGKNFTLEEWERKWAALYKAFEAVCSRHAKKDGDSIGRG